MTFVCRQPHVFEYDAHDVPGMTRTRSWLISELARAWIRLILFRSVRFSDILN